MFNILLSAARSVWLCIATRYSANVNSGAAEKGLSGAGAGFPPYMICVRFCDRPLLPFCPRRALACSKFDRDYNRSVITRAHSRQRGSTP